MEAQKRWIYVLALEGGKFYVGQSTKPVERIESHVAGSGSAWTRAHAPYRVVTCFAGDRFDEDVTTKRYMAQYGVDNVRGGSYCQLTLSEQQRAVLQLERATVEGDCFRCGQPGHYAAQCTRAPAPPQQKKAPPRDKQPQRWRVAMGGCARCGRSTHKAKHCYARRDVRGRELWSSSSSSTDSDDGYY